MADPGGSADTRGEHAGTKPRSARAYSNPRWINHEERDYSTLPGSQFWWDSGGQDLIEYSLGAGMVALAAVAAMPHLDVAVSNIFVKIGSLINSAV